MTKLAPRQGIFAIILLISFVFHVLILLFNTEKQQFDIRTSKSEKIVAQLGKEALSSIVNQDRISLSVLLNRYQVDDDIASLIITDKDKRILASIGKNDVISGQVLEQDVVYNNQTVGQVIVNMKATAKSQIISEQLFFIIGSFLLHILIWLCYTYMARPTKEQLLLIQQRIQQVFLKNQQLNQQNSPVGNENVEKPLEKEKATPPKSIDDFLMHSRRNQMLQTPSPVENPPQPEEQPVVVNPIDEVPKTQVVIRFFDTNELLKHIAPELSEPYYQFCEELLQQTIYHLFNPQQTSDILRPYTQGVTVERINTFSKDGVMFNLLGDDNKLAMAGVLVGKLFIILNQVMYEKHRELGRFALPTQVGIGNNQQLTEINQLMSNHGQEDGILFRLPENMIATLYGNVQLKNLRSASNLAEREMLYYDGLSAILMETLIAERDKILRYTR